MQGHQESETVRKTDVFATGLLLKGPVAPSSRGLVRGRVLSTASVGISSRRRAFIRQALALAVFSMLASLVETVAGIGFGTGEHSVSLFGFGLDAIAEVGSAALVLWRFAEIYDGHIENPARRIARERRASSIIGGLLLLFGVSISWGAALGLVRHSEPLTALPGMLIALMSLTVMSLLWGFKKKIALRLDSSSLLLDAGCSWVCMRLSMVVLFSSFCFFLWRGLWWIDGVAGVVLGAMVFQEGWNALQAARQPNFHGGCGCKH